MLHLALMSVEFYLCSEYHSISKHSTPSVIVGRSPSLLVLTNTSDLPFVSLSIWQSGQISRKREICWPSECWVATDTLGNSHLQLFLETMDEREEDEVIAPPPALPPPLSSNGNTVSAAVPTLDKHNFGNVCIADVTWTLWLQNTGCDKDEMPK